MTRNDVAVPRGATQQWISHSKAEGDRTTYALVDDADGGAGQKNLKEPHRYEKHTK